MVHQLERPAGVGFDSRTGGKLWWPLGDIGARDAAVGLMEDRMERGKPRPEDGRGEWLSELYQANARAVESYCRRFLNSAEDAADATHEVFLRALSSLDASPNSSQARGWLITVAQNYCLDVVRRRRRMQAALTTLGADAGRATESEAEVINRQLLQAVLQQL